MNTSVQSIACQIEVGVMVLPVLLAYLLLVSVGCVDATDNLAKPEPLVVTVNDGAALQKAMVRHGGGTVRISEPTTITCSVLESVVGDEISRHALLIPPGIELDLNGSTLTLDLRSNSHGVRLSSNSAIRNGTIRVVHSEGKGSQAIWHSGISVGAPYDDGGTPAKPSYFSKVSNWRIEDITIDQQVEASAIQLMSEACFGAIRRVQILDSPKALIGIGLDWGSVGKVTTADDQIPRMRELWERGEIYSTHPHDILIEDIRVGHLTRNVDGNDAGVRCSACYNIQIRNVQVASAATAVAIFGGDCGFEFAPISLRPLAHVGYEIDSVVIDTAFRYGIVLNGLADNVYRSSENYGYETLIDTAHPGLNRVVVSNCRLNGGGTPNNQGIFITAVTEAEVRNVVVEGFGMGARIKNWVNGLRFVNCDLARNNEPYTVLSTVEAPRNLVFE